MNGVIWCFGKAMFYAIKVWGIESTSFQTLELPVWPMFTIVALTGVLDGFIFALIDILIDKKFKSLRFSSRVITKTIINMCFGLCITVLLSPVFIRLLYGQEVDMLARQVYTAQFIVLTLYFLILTLLVQFFKLSMTWMKTQDIFEVIANPHGVEENRIFIFLDMRASTSLAERLDPTVYSRLLQACFHDLSEAARESSAEIYQYVGDEAVLTWKETPDNFINAVHFYFKFQAKLKNRAFEYERRFEAVPEFKAGLHNGKVIKAQVGMMHKEIAFHGDPINTASRIQGKCNELEHDLLLSESFKENLMGVLACTWVGKFCARGKSVEMDLFSISESTFQAFLNEKLNYRPLESVATRLFMSLSVGKLFGWVI